MVTKSKKYFLLDYKFIISILFINVFSVVSMQDGCFASVMLKSNIALLLSLAAEGLYNISISHGRFSSAPFQLVQD